MPGLDDYGALLRSGAASVPDYAEEQAKQQLLAIRRSEMQARTAELMDKLAQRKAFGEDVTSVLADPNPKNVSSLILKHPEYADQIKGAWDIKDKASKQADLTQLSEIYSAGQAGKWDVAAKAARTRFDADTKAGQADPTEEAIVTALESGDPAERNKALGMIGVQVAAATGAEHFGTVFGAIGGGDYTLDAGAARFHGGKIIAHSPFVKDDEGNTRLWTDVPGEEGAGPQPMDEGRPAQIAAGLPRVPTGAPGQVATVLSAGGIPAPVVAGFLGNFHAEGGYHGGKGDGGSASGIGQWRAERAANFEKVVGKPISEATPEEQAGFVIHEMQHPEEAGMTVGQRDAILAAKTPAQAAALIDQFYERSTGVHRQKRMAAAASYAAGAAQQPYYGGPGASPAGVPSAPGVGQFPILFKGKGPTKRIMTPQEAKAKGLPDTQTYQIDDKTGDISPISGTAEAQDALDPQTTSFYAQQILAGGQMPALGMGKSAAAARQAIMREVSRQAQTLGLSGKDLATQQAHFKNATAGLRTLETQAMTVGANEETALLNGQQFLDRSKELTAKTRFPIVNAATMAFLRHTGDPTVIAMDNAYNTFITEYAKVVAGSPSGAGVLSDSARHEAMSTLKGNYAYPQKVAAFKQMQKDMANRMAAIRSGIAYGYKNMSVVPGSTRELRVPTSNEGLPKGAKVVGTYQGKRVIEVNGRRMVEQ